MSLFDIEVIEQGVQIGCMIVWLIGQTGSTKAARVVSYHPVVFVKKCDLRPPHNMAEREAMYKNNRFARTDCLIVDLAVVKE